MNASMSVSEKAVDGDAQEQKFRMVGNPLVACTRLGNPLLPHLRQDDAHHTAQDELQGEIQEDETQGGDVRDGVRNGIQGVPQLDHRHRSCSLQWIHKVLQAGSCWEGLQVAVRWVANSQLDAGGQQVAHVLLTEGGQAVVGDVLAVGGYLVVDVQLVAAQLVAVRLEVAQLAADQLVVLQMAAAQPVAAQLVVAQLAAAQLAEVLGFEETARRSLQVLVTRLARQQAVSHSAVSNSTVVCRSAACSRSQQLSAQPYSSAYPWQRQQSLAECYKPHACCQTNGCEAAPRHVGFDDPRLLQLVEAKHGVCRPDALHHAGQGVRLPTQASGSRKAEVRGCEAQVASRQDVLDAPVDVHVHVGLERQLVHAARVGGKQDAPGVPEVDVHVHVGLDRGLVHVASGGSRQDVLGAPEVVDVHAREDLYRRLMHVAWAGSRQDVMGAPEVDVRARDGLDRRLGHVASVEGEQDVMGAPEADVRVREGLDRRLVHAAKVEGKSLGQHIAEGLWVVDALDASDGEGKLCGLKLAHDLVVPHVPKAAHVLRLMRWPQVVHNLEVHGPRGWAEVHNQHEANGLRVELRVALGVVKGGQEELLEDNDAVAWNEQSVRMGG
eukprot:TRINITY_DN2860_c0_g1_i2.p2 TRINITY_DN2860_c0_g1~~TRINITY_DN2860_c0_g1_i2.p2  ORF type:complete len:609 (-),score=96.11 TRINITY_DN2860_c0_g1_i2:604-2430(-)